MVTRGTAYCLFAILILLSTSCGKDDDPYLPPVDPPRGEDSLGIGWQKIPMPDSIQFFDVFFVDDMTGYLAGDKYLGKSIDGGLTWIQLTIPGSQQGGFSNLYFTDALHGCAVGAGVIWTTKDGGQNWQGKGGLLGYDVQFITATEGYLGSSEGLHKTIDGGINWTKLPAITTKRTALFFLNNNVGWTAGANAIEKTEDGGNLFGTAVPVPNADGIYVIQFTDNNHGWSSSFNGTINRTINGGVSWEKIVTSDKYSDIHFFDNNNGILFSGFNIYRTNDGGTTLIKDAIMRKSYLIEIHFTNPNHGWAVGDKGGLYRYSK